MKLSGAPDITGVPAAGGRLPTSLVTPVGRCCPSTTRFSTATISSTFSSGMSRAPPTWRMALHALPARWECAWPEAALGATNLDFTGIATAYTLDLYSNQVAITGQSTNFDAIGKDAFQEADITGITMPITKHNYLVKNVEDLAQALADAFYIARTGRPGPVLVDIPLDAGKNIIEFDPKGGLSHRHQYPILSPGRPSGQSSGSSDSQGCPAYS